VAVSSLPILDVFRSVPLCLISLVLFYNFVPMVGLDLNRFFLVLSSDFLYRVISWLNVARGGIGPLRRSMRRASRSLWFSLTADLFSWLFCPLAVVLCFLLGSLCTCGWWKQRVGLCVGLIVELLKASQILFRTQEPLLHYCLSLARLLSLSYPIHFMLLKFEKRWAKLIKYVICMKHFGDLHVLKGINSCQ